MDLNENSYDNDYVKSETIPDNTLNACVGTYEKSTENIIINVLQTQDKEKMNKSLPERIPAFGLIMALLGVTCFSFGSAIVKVLTELHAIECLLFRALFQLIFYFISTLINCHPFFGVEGHRIDLAMRSLTGTISFTAIYIAYRLMPLGDVLTILFSQPVFVTVFAHFMLNERITILQIITCIIAMTGVVIISKPEFIFGSESIRIYSYRFEGVILAIVASVTGAFAMIYLRKLKTTPVPVVVLWFAIIVIITCLIIMGILNVYVWPTQLRTWLLLLVIGICGIGDQYFFCLAFKYESAGPVSVTMTFSIVLAFIWGIVILNESMEWTSFVGASLVIIAVTILAMVKWSNENLTLLKTIKTKLCFCYKN